MNVVTKTFRIIFFNTRPKCVVLDTVFKNKRSLTLNCRYDQIFSHPHT